MAYYLSISAIVLLAVFELLVPADAISARLVSAHAAQRRTGRRAAAQQRARRLAGVLRSGTEQLKRALWDELSVEPGQPLTYLLAAQARDRLAQEADYLAAEDEYASALLHDFARSAFIPALAAQLELPQQSAPPAAYMAPATVPRSPLAAAPELRTVESSETVVQEDAHGNLLRTSRHCRGRHCLTETEEIPLDEEEYEAPVIAEMDPHAEVDGEDYEEPVITERVPDAERVEEDYEEPVITERDPDSERAEETGNASEGSLSPLGGGESLLSLEDGGALDGALEEVGREAEEPEEADGFDEEEWDQESLVAPKELPPVDTMVESVANALGSAVRVAARNMAKDLKETMQDSGLPPFSVIMNGLMNSTVARGIMNIAKDVTASNAAGAELNAALNGEGLAKFVQDFLAGIDAHSTTFGNLADAESTFTVTFVEDGRKVRRTRHCRQGQCTASTEPVAEESEVARAAETTEE
eukprot:CAMPEP_0171195286 /NCGR_PEP_ID=MMETSP0790-20130122/21320_1 /TAXON_ID=2925 /ORGANISM="Alexandrium catenella, Strain OF101" /LENGTH=471 /DNA_ID=CAMNT_0011660497 /DNA_START=59 /DNA_END=1474 /DNA_ORIENTATION=+